MNSTTPSSATGIDLDLLPCPFCGGAARFDRIGNWHDLVVEHVRDCYLSSDAAEMSYLDSPGVRERMASKWNQRALARRATQQADIPAGCAVDGKGTTYHNIEEIYHRMEEGEALHKWLDDQGVPRADAAGKVYSPVGRVMRLLESSQAGTGDDPIGDLQRQAREAKFSEMAREWAAGTGDADERARCALARLAEEAGRVMDTQEWEALDFGLIERALAKQAAAKDTTWYKPLPTPDQLLAVARDTGLRSYLHGVNATEAKEILFAYIDAVRLLDTGYLPAAPIAPPIGQQEGLYQAIINLQPESHRTIEYKKGHDAASVAAANLVLQQSAPAPTAAVAGQDARDVARLRKILLDVRHALQFANYTPGGAISDTIWMIDEPETLFDFIDAALVETKGDKE